MSFDSIQRRVMKVGTEAIRNTSGRVFKFGPIYSTLCKCKLKDIQCVCVCLFVNIHTVSCYFCHLHALLRKRKSHHLHHRASVRYSSNDEGTKKSFSPLLLSKREKKKKRKRSDRRPHLQLRLFGYNFSLPL